MATITDIRQNWLSPFLGRVDTAGLESTETRPWNNVSLNQYLYMAMDQLWPELGVLSYEDIDSDGAIQDYPAPLEMQRIARIDVLNIECTRYIDRVANFTMLPGGAFFMIKPPVMSGVCLRVVGWRPYDREGSDLTTRLEPAVAEKAASLAYTALASELLHSQRQQNLDTGRAIGYGDASAQSAYWEARFRSSIARDPGRVAVGPRSAYR